MIFIDRVLRAMTHLNVGATIAMKIWICWSGLAVIAPSFLAARPPHAAPAPEAPRAPARPCPCMKPTHAVDASAV